MDELVKQLLKLFYRHRLGYYGPVRWAVIGASESWPWIPPEMQDLLVELKEMIEEGEHDRAKKD